VERSRFEGSFPEAFAIARLIDTLQGKRVVTIVGNAKNAGKTTVLNALTMAENGRYTAITSIGLDGEELDQITRLPKPRIIVLPGMIVATAKDCLKASHALYKILETTDLATPLGLIQIVEIQSEGTMLVAGPSNRSQMDLLCRRLLELGAVRVYVDGAFSRRQFARVGDALVLVFGANFAYDMSTVVKQAALWTQLYSLPKGEGDWQGEPLPDRVAWLCASGWKPLVESRAIDFTETTFRTIPADAEGLYIPFSLTDAAARLWLRHPDSKRLFLRLASPSHVLLSTSVLERLLHRAPKIDVVESIDVACLCVNPFSPSGHSFDKDDFLQAVQNAVDKPVFDVLAKGDTP
jgi:hypothetical protein